MSKMYVYVDEDVRIEGGEALSRDLALIIDDEMVVYIPKLIIAKLAHIVSGCKCNEEPGPKKIYNADKTPEIDTTE